MLSNINKWIIVKYCLNNYANIMLFLNKNNGMTSEQRVFWVYYSLYYLFEFMFIFIFSI